MRLDIEIEANQRLEADMEENKNIIKYVNERQAHVEINHKAQAYS